MKKLILPMFLVFILLSSSVQAGITGLSRIEIRDDNIFPGGSDKVWVLNWNAINTDFVEGTVTPSEFEDDTGVQSSGSFSLKVDSGDEYAQYRIFDSGLNNVFTSRVLHHEEYDFGENDQIRAWINNNCRDVDGDNRLENGVDYSHFENPFQYNKVACVDKQSNKIGTIRSIRNPEMIFTTEWTLNIDGKIETRTLSNADAIGDGSTTRFGDTAVIKWQGNLNTGKQAPDPDNVLAAHDNSFPNNWRVIDEDRYDRWNFYMGNSLGNCLDDVTRSLKDDQRDQISSFCTEQMNDRAKDAILVKDQGIFRFAQVDDPTLTNGAFRLDRDIDGQTLEGIAIPSYQLFLNADQLRLVVPIGEPDILRVQDEPVRVEEGRQGIAKVDMKNIGSKAGSFEARLISCSSGFTPTGLVQKFNLDGGKEITKQFSIGFTATSGSAEQSGQCTVEMEETTSGETDRFTFDVNGVQAPECTPGQRFATVDASSGNEAIAECQEDGVNTIIVEVCDTGASVVNEGGTLVCKSPDKPPTCPPGTEPKKEFIYFGDTICVPIDGGEGFQQNIPAIVYGVNLAIIGLAGLSLLRKRL